MSNIKAFMKILALTCEESARMMSDSYETDLSWVQRTALRTHRFNCRWCRRVSKQLESLHIANKYFHTHERTNTCCPGHRLSNDAKERMIQKLS